MLRAADADFRHFDILQDPEVRDGLKVLRHILTSFITLTSQASTCMRLAAARVLTVSRHAAQEHSNWPTYPQLYINGEVSVANLWMPPRIPAAVCCQSSFDSLSQLFRGCGINTLCLDVYTVAWWM